MSYTPTTWTTGDVITAAKLNKIEEGIANAGAGGLLQVQVNNGTLDKTWKEITDAPFSVVKDSDGVVYLYMGGFSEDGEYCVNYWSYGLSHPGLFIADSQDGYPVLSSDSP